MPLELFNLALHSLLLLLLLLRQLTNDRVQLGQLDHARTSVRARRASKLPPIRVQDREWQLLLDPFKRSARNWLWWCPRNAVEQIINDDLGWTRQRASSKRSRTGRIS